MYALTHLCRYVHALHGMFQACGHVHMHSNPPLQLPCCSCKGQVCFKVCLGAWWNERQVGTTDTHSAFCYQSNCCSEFQVSHWRLYPMHLSNKLVHTPSANHLSASDVWPCVTHLWACKAKRLPWSEWAKECFLQGDHDLQPHSFGGGWTHITSSAALANSDKRTGYSDLTSTMQFCLSHR
jgi:hypothetical protein